MSQSAWVASAPVGGRDVVVVGAVSVDLVVSVSARPGPSAERYGGGKGARTGMPDAAAVEAAIEVASGGGPR